MSVHKALLFRQWSTDVVSFADDHQLEPQDRANLDALDVVVVSTQMVTRAEPFAGIGAQVGAAAADGARAAQHINADLVMKDLDRAVAALADAQTNEGDAR